MNKNIKLPYKKVSRIVMHGVYKFATGKKKPNKKINFQRTDVTNSSGSYLFFDYISF